MTMADQCPQGFTDMEMPAETMRLLVELDLATWDSEDGVHKLTDRGIEWFQEMSDV